LLKTGRAQDKERQEMRPEMEAILLGFKNMEHRIKVCRFFEKRDLDFMLKWFEAMAANMRHTILKAAPAKAEQATNTQQAAAQNGGTNEFIGVRHFGRTERR